MGIVWEAYHKGVPLLGVPGITLELGSDLDGVAVAPVNLSRLFFCITWDAGSLKTMDHDIFLERFQVSISKPSLAELFLVAFASKFGRNLLTFQHFPLTQIDIFFFMLALCRDLFFFGGKKPTQRWHNWGTQKLKDVCRWIWSFSGRWAMWLMWLNWVTTWGILVSGGFTPIRGEMIQFD